MRRVLLLPAICKYAIRNIYTFLTTRKLTGYKKHAFAVFIGCFLIIFILLCMTLSSKFNKPDYNFPASIGPDSSLGLMVNQEIMRSQIAYNSQTVVQYVNYIGQTLARNSGRPDLPFRFIVVKDQSINAFASPGGYIYITTDMLNLLRTESELAAVLAHEISHITARHHVKQAATQLGLDLTFDYLGRLFNYNPQTTIPQLAQFALLQKFSRTEETQADEIGTRILARTGYSPYGMVRLLEAFQSIERRGIFSAFTASHPTSIDRVRHVETFITRNRLATRGQIVDRQIFHTVKSLL